MPRAKQSQMPLLLEVQFGTGRRGVPHVRRLREWAQATYLAHSHIHLGASRGKKRRKAILAAQVSLRIVDSKESRHLNYHWRGKDKATNVLSFPVDGSMIEFMSDGSAYVLGDLAICAAVVAREASEQEKKPDSHWAHMVIHGVLHLLGYDHETARDAKVMEALEVAVMQQFGFTNPYE